MRTSFKILALVVGVLFASSIFSTTWSPVSAQTVISQGFTVINSIWGTSTAPVEAGPGSQDVPLTITLQYLYTYASVSAEFEIKLPAGITSTASSVTGQDVNNATAFYVNRLDQGQIFQITLYLDLANSTSLGVYTFPSTIFWYAILSNSTSQPEVYLQQDLNLEANLNGNSKLSYSTNDTALTPNKINNVTLTLTNSGSGNVTDISTTVSASSTLASILNELPSSINLAAGASFNESLQIFVPQSAAGSIFALNFATTYLDAYQNQESITQSLGFFVNSLNTLSPLTYTISDTSLVPGGVNNLTMTLTNTGQASLTSISTVVSVPIASTTIPGVSVVSQPVTVTTLAPGASATLSFSVFVSATAAGTPVTLTLSSTYINPSGLSESFTSNTGLYVSNLTTSTSPVISVSEINSYVTTGIPSQVSIEISNSGFEPIYDPSFSLSTTSPLYISANSTFSMMGTHISPGGRVVYEPTISSGPSSAVGVYGGTLTVSYVNQFGVASTQVAQVSFTLTGRIVMVVQGELISQGSETNLSVSGTLLNEGTVSAYYATAVGYLQGSSPNNTFSTYIGEVDVNTPVPFTMTVPYTAGSSSSTANVSVLISYQDSFGRNLTYVSSMPAILLSAAQLSQQSSSSATTSHPVRAGGGVFLLSLIIVIVVVVAAVIVVRRRSSKKGKKSNVI